MPAGHKHHEAPADATAAPDVLGSPAPLSAPAFDEVTAEADGAATILSHSREEHVVQAIALGFSVAAFVLFVIVGLPALNLTGTGTLLWMLVGIVLLVIVGLATQARTQSTRIRLDAVGLEIDQGTPIDREHVAIAWNQLKGAELEPVNPRDGRKGMLLRLALREGEPVDTLVDVGVGDLNEARRIIVHEWHRHAAQAPATPAT